MKQDNPPSRMKLVSQGNALRHSGFENWKSHGHTNRRSLSLSLFIVIHGKLSFTKLINVIPELNIGFQWGHSRLSLPFEATDNRGLAIKQGIQPSEAGGALTGAVPSVEWLTTTLTNLSQRLEERSPRCWGTRKEKSYSASADAGESISGSLERQRVAKQQSGREYLQLLDGYFRVLQFYYSCLLTRSPAINVHVRLARGGKKAWQE